MRGSKVSKRYAKALLSLGQEDGNYLQYGKDLQEFTDFCQTSTEFGAVIANQVFSIEDRKVILQKVFEKSKLTDTVRNFLNLLLDKNRMGALEDITVYYERLTDAISNIARAEVTAPVALKSDALERLSKTLEAMTSKTVKMEIKEDNSLIGGIIVKIGDLVLDGSVKAQLEGLKELLKRGEYS